MASGGNVIAGRTAAWVHGLWTPPPGQLIPLELARPRDASGEPMVGTSRSRRVWRMGEDPDVLELGALRVTSPMRTCFDLMRVRQLVEAVVVADAFAFAGAVNLEQLAAYVEQHRRWPGVRRARQAVRLADAKAASSGETRMRMVVVLSGFPEPVVNAKILVADGARFLDLLLDKVPRPCGLEYDGIYHRERAQRRLDLRRENSILVGTHLPLLRYDHVSVSCEREHMVEEVVLTTGFTDVQPLRAKDFFRGPAEFGW